MSTLRKGSQLGFTTIHPSAWLFCSGPEGEERDARVRSIRKGFLEEEAAAGSKNDSGLVCPTAGLRALRTLGGRQREGMEKRDGWEQLGGRQSSGGLELFLAALQAETSELKWRAPCSLAAVLQTHYCSCWVWRAAARPWVQLRC